MFAVHRRQFDDDRQGGHDRRRQANAKDKAQQREKSLRARDDTDQCGAKPTDEGADDGLGLGVPTPGEPAKDECTDNRSDAASRNSARSAFRMKCRSRPGFR